jgi:hypothetical protein
MSAPRQVHLLSADEAQAEGYRHGGPLALCGEPLGTPDLPSASCPDECYCELTYCPGCLDVATRRNWEAGLEVGCPPGITVATGSRPDSPLDPEQLCPNCQGATR